MASPFEPRSANVLAADRRGEEPSHESGGGTSGKAPWAKPEVNRESNCLGQKRVASCRRVFFLHMRKAAGTSVRKLLKEVSRRCGLEIDVQEGGTLDLRRLEDPATFTVTCLREPVDRICSLYNYQGRWVPEDEEKKPEAAVSFASWLNWIPTPRTWKLWDETADYYTKTLAGGPLNTRGVGVDAARYARAVQALDQFDLVLLCEGFGIPEYDAWWTERLGLDRTAEIPKLHATRRMQSQYDIRRHLTDELLRDVRTRNQWDAQLYHHARMRSPVVPAVGALGGSA